MILVELDPLTDKKLPDNWAIDPLLFVVRVSNDALDAKYEPDNEAILALLFNILVSNEADVEV